MFDELRKKLYFARFEVLITKAYREGKIMDFDDEIFEKMKGTIIACFPVSLYIKYSKYLFPLGTCYDRSLYMFLALDDALLVRGENKDLVYNYGKGHGGHGWIEVGDYVYDPSLMLKFDKKTYYQLYGCSKVFKIDKDSYVREHKEFVDAHVSTDFDEFKPDGRRRLELGAIVTATEHTVQSSGDEDFAREFYDYLESIQFDRKQIQEERDRVIQDILKNERAIAMLSGKALG